MVINTYRHVLGLNEGLDKRDTYNFDLTLRLYIGISYAVEKLCEYHAHGMRGPDVWCDSPILLTYN